jgi:molybdenum cofactor guanylyltransferase
MQASGFVLAGGASKRMGRDKALLPYAGTTLVEHVAKTVRDAAGSVTLIGDPSKLGALGMPVIPDQVPSCGPVSGIYTALRVTQTDWNLVLACDMPSVTSAILRELLRRAETSATHCVAASGSEGLAEPLCALYHRRCLPALEQAIRDKRFKMRHLVDEIGVTLAPVSPLALANLNTPAEWAELESRLA